MTHNIEQFDNRPWVPHHIPNSIRKELYRRTIDQGVTYVDAMSGWYDNTDVKWTESKGPMSSWVRITSNGNGISKNKKTILSHAELEKQKRDGFVLYGGQGFYDAFGSAINETNRSIESNILGYDVYGEPHKLDLQLNYKNVGVLSGNRAAPLLLPPPGIISIEANLQKERIRRTTINWKCYSFAQLEYMTPYLLTPGISVIAEFGWNHFNIGSLLNLTDKHELTALFINGTPLYDKILNSNGMYDVTFGIIANFDFSTSDGMTYDCKTEIYSKHRNYSGAYTNESSKVSFQLNTKNQKESVTAPSLYEFCNQRLKKVTSCLERKKNFFEPLDSAEESKKDYVSLKSEFFNGSVENRVFLARNKIKGDPFDIYNQPDNKCDWDAGSPDDTWVTMGFVVDLVNMFVTQRIETPNTDEKQSYDLYKINIDDVVIGGHPNLISCDGDSVLIPNPISPKFNLGAYFWKADYVASNTPFEKNTFQSQTSYKTYAAFENDGPRMSLHNKRLFDVFKTGYGIDISAETKKFEKQQQPTFLENFLENTGIKNADIQMSSAGIFNEASTTGAYRDDLDLFINRFRYAFGDNKSKLKVGSAAFPQREDYVKNGNSVKKYYWGYLKDIYININLIMECAQTAKSAEEFFQVLLGKISGAVGNFWELSVIEDEKTLRIIDKKFMSKKIYDNLFQMDISSDSFIKSLSFTVTPSNAQMNQILAGSSNNKGNNTGTTTATELPDFYYGDRLGVNRRVPDSGKTMVNESSDLIKQLQNYGKVSGAYTVSLKRGDAISPEYYEVYNLALPSKNLLLTLLNCEDYSENINVYGAQQQNFTCEIVLQGIAGLRTFQCFSIKNLPKPYSPDEVIFCINDISHTVQNGEWLTTIKAAIRPKTKLENSPLYTYSNGKDAFDSTEDFKLENIE
jgi:hypothetical protein